MDKLTDFKFCGYTETELMQMIDFCKTKTSDRLIVELSTLRAALEACEAERDRYKVALSDLNNKILLLALLYREVVNARSGNLKELLHIIVYAQQNLNPAPQIGKEES